MEHAGNVLSVSLPERAAGVLQRNLLTYGSDLIYRTLFYFLCENLDI